MQIAYILYDGITTLDFIGVYDPISRLKSMNFLPGLNWDICATTAVVRDPHGLAIVVDKVEPDLSSYDGIVVPGGFGTRLLQTDKNFLAWLKTAHSTDYKISVCTGSLLLGAAGFVKGKTATTHFDHYDELAAYGARVKKAQIVTDGSLITAGAVTASLELGLHLCEKWAGGPAKEEIKKRMNYKS